MTTSNQTTQATPNSPMLSEALGEQIARYGKASFGQDLELVKVITLFIDNGFKSTDLKSPKSKGSTATVEQFEWCKEQVRNGFDAPVKALLALSAKAAGDKQHKGQGRVYWSKQPNAIVGGLSTQLRNREVINAEIENGKQGPDARTRSPEAIVAEGVDKLILKLQKLETFNSDVPLVELIIQLKEVRGAIKA